MTGNYPQSWPTSYALLNHTLDHPTSLFAAIRWNEAGLVPAIVQDAQQGDVLMLAWMNQESLERTLATGTTHFYSRSRSKIWRKGETSGHTQELDSLALDCDGDVLLLKVRQHGGACHEGYRSCFFRSLDHAGSLVVSDHPVFDPNSAYKKG